MIETTTTIEPERRARIEPMPQQATAFTVEQAAYVVVMGLALGLRLYGLGGRPLAPDEGQRALNVWNFARGLVVDPTGYTPPLFYPGLLTLLIAGANDLTARVPALLFGTVLVGLPYFLRSWLGRPGALATSALLALSPVMIFFSRNYDEPVVTATLCLALLIAAVRFIEQPERRRLLWLAAALGVALTAGPGVYTLLLAALIFAAGAALTARATRPTQEGGLSRPDHRFQPILNDRAGLVEAVAVLAGTFLVTATGLLLNFAGLQAALNGLAAWFSQFAGPSAGSGPATVSQVLLFYEPLILVMGLAGVVLALWQRDRFGIFLLVWFSTAWLIATVVSHKVPGTVMPVVLPLCMLAGLDIGRLVEGLVAHATLEVDGLLAGLVIILAAYGLLQVVNYANDPQSMYLVMGLIAFAFAGALTVLFAFAWGAAGATRGLGLAAVVVLGVLAMHSSTWLNYRSQDAPQEWLLPSAGSTDEQRLVNLMHSIAYQRERDPNTTAVTVEAGLMPALGWYLRDFESVTAAQTVGVGGQVPLLLVGARPDKAAQSGYIGQRFRVGTNWTPAGLSGVDLLRWYFLRSAPQPPQSVDAILYVTR